MEAQLKLYSGFLGIYNERYCILVDKVLTICYQRGGEIEGQIHIGVYSAKRDQRSLILTLNNGFHDLTLKFGSRDELDQWYDQLKALRAEFLGKETTKKRIKGLSTLSHDLTIKKDFKDLKLDSGFLKLNKSLSEIWNYQARLNEAMNEVHLKIPSNITFTNFAEKIQEVSTQLKVTKKPKFDLSQKFYFRDLILFFVLFFSCR